MPTEKPDLSHYGPWAVIAGGSEGVGAAFAEQLAGAGINLVLLARKPGPLEESAERCRALGVEVRTLTVDLTAPQTVSDVAEATADIEVGLLIYNAGAESKGGPFLDTDLDHLRRLVELNVNTPIALVQHFGRLMRERRRGGIVLSGSLSGAVGSAHHSVYSGVKAFDRIFAEGLWLEMRDYDVHVLGLVLGLTRTPAMERAGIPMDLPGVPVSEPADVAHEGLSFLPHGPIRIAGENHTGEAFRNDLDRAKVALTMDEGSKRMAPRKANA